MLKNLLLGVTEHKSARHTSKLIAELAKAFHVRVILTEGSKKFVSEVPPCAVDDAHEWHEWKQVCPASHTSVVQGIL
jgi:hypothetical protein